MPKHTTVSIISKELEDQEGPYCPLCIEPLTQDEQEFFPCECGYQVCSFCLQKLKDINKHECPGCRKVYVEEKFQYKKKNFQNGQFKKLFTNSLNNKINKQSYFQQTSPCGSINSNQPSMFSKHFQNQIDDSLQGFNQNQYNLQQDQGLVSDNSSEVNNLKQQYVLQGQLQSSNWVVRRNNNYQIDSQSSTFNNQSNNLEQSQSILGQPYQLQSKNVNFKDQEFPPLGDGSLSTSNLYEKPSLFRQGRRASEKFNEKINFQNQNQVQDFQAFNFAQGDTLQADTSFQEQKIPLTSELQQQANQTFIQQQADVNPDTLRIMSLLGINKAPQDQKLQDSNIQSVPPPNFIPFTQQDFNQRLQIQECQSQDMQSLQVQHPDQKINIQDQSMSDQTLMDVYFNQLEQKQQYTQLSDIIQKDDMDSLARQLPQTLQAIFGSANFNFTYKINPRRLSQIRQPLYSLNGITQNNGQASSETLSKSLPPGFSEKPYKQQNTKKYDTFSNALNNNVQLNIKVNGQQENDKQNKKEQKYINGATLNGMQGHQNGFSQQIQKPGYA